MSDMRVSPAAFSWSATETVSSSYSAPAGPADAHATVSPGPRNAPESLPESRVEAFLRATEKRPLPGPGLDDTTPVRRRLLPDPGLDTFVTIGEHRSLPDPGLDAFATGGEHRSLPDPRLAPTTTPRRALPGPGFDVNSLPTREPQLPSSGLDALFGAQPHAALARFRAGAPAGAGEAPVSTLGITFARPPYYGAPLTYMPDSPTGNWLRVGATRDTLNQANAYRHEAVSTRVNQSPQPLQSHAVTPREPDAEK